MNNNFAKRLCELSAFVMIAVMLSYIEHLFPIGAFIPVPGIKLGLSNILSLYLVTRHRTADAFITVISKSLFSFLLFGNGISFILSLSGNIVSVIFTVCFLFMLKRGYTNITLSIIGASFFNVAQICASAFFYGAPVFYYLPPLLFSALITGALTGYVGNISFGRIDVILKRV
ncbi:MAG: Gx transporter family protein [Ruminococcaceae bacterium]|nr:Gx transporter family protein [Oscillospiraceae bacterium]